MLLEPLKLLNGRGFLTINSQPQVNGAPSTDGVVGWGNSNGFVYQKAYLEFFCSPQSVERLLSIIDEGDYPSLSYQAINRDGKLKSNVDLNAVNAVTWGVFQNCEILQPTIVDPQSFVAWKDEAFSLWTTMWQSIYSKESVSWSLIEGIKSNWFLVNIVENDYINGNIFGPFVELLRDDPQSKKIRNIIKKSLQSQHQKWCCSSWKRIMSPEETITLTMDSDKQRDARPCTEEEISPLNMRTDSSPNKVQNPYLDVSLLTEKPLEAETCEEEVVERKD